MSELTVTRHFHMDCGLHIYASIRQPSSRFAEMIKNAFARIGSEIAPRRPCLMAEAVFEGESEPDIRPYRPVTPGTVPGHILEGAHASFTEPEMDRIGRALEQGRLQRATVGFDGAELRYRRVGPNYHTVQLRVPHLFTDEGATSRPQVLGLMFGAEATWTHAWFDGLQAYHGQIEILVEPLDPYSTPARELVTWPPAAHWSNYLSRPLLGELGDLSSFRRALDGLDIVQRNSGAWSVTLPVDPRQAWNPSAQPWRDRFRSAVTVRLPPVSPTLTAS